MSDQNVHEIQLSGKQLVFLFMSTVVVAVVIFLLGVSVGRGVRGATMASAAVDAGAPGDTVVSTIPPPTQPAPGELSYHDALQGRGAGTPAAPPPPPPVEPPAQARPQQTTPQQTPPAGPPAAREKPPQTAAKVSDKPAVPRASATGAWVVQVIALSNKDSADKLVRDLKTKGYPAFVVSPASGLFRVRVGPFPKRAEAEQIAGRLAKEGYQPSVQAR